MGQRTREGAPATQARNAENGGQAARRRLMRAIGGWFAAGDGWAALALILLPILARTPELLGLVHANALSYFAALGTRSHGFVGGQPTIDPNIGFTSQALGAQAAHQWLAGRVPWWNPYEGVGTPLAGEMQSAAFFPLTMLLVFPWGQTVFHVGLQIIAGLATWALLRQLGLAPLAAFTGGVLFEFNGVFAWLANAVVNPVAFLPLLLLGIERALASVRRMPVAGDEARGWRGWARDAATGWTWIAVALALSLLSGFPEVAYLDGLLAALWALARQTTLRGWLPRARFALKLALGLVVGVAIAAPPLLAFADYTRVANLGVHGAGTASMALPNLSLVQYLFPYVYGGIFQYSAPPGVAISWGNIGGYVGATVAFLALLGAVSARRNLPLRIALVAWIALMVGRSVGAQPFAAIVNHLPLVDTVAVYRYANASWILAAIVLAALAIDDWRGSRRDKLKALACAAITLGGLCLGALWLALPTLRALFQNPLFLKKLSVGSLAVEVGAILALLAALLLTRASPDGEASPSTRTLAALRVRPQALLMSLFAVALALAYFIYPMLANPRQVTVDTAAIRYLQAHSGYQRFFTLGPFQPNYGAYFDLASVNYDDVPSPQRWADYVHAHLDPYANPLLFLNIPRPPGAPSLADEVAARLPAYEAVGVKYVLTVPGDQPFAALPASQRPTLVYQDAVLWIYQTPDPAPLFGVADGASCQMRTRSWTEADTVCAAPATLIYRGMADPGWRATINGRPVAITIQDGVFQRVNLPAGPSRVSFTYAPPHAELALLAAALGVLALAAACAISLWQRTPQSAQQERSRLAV